MEWYKPITIFPGIGFLILSISNFLISLNDEIREIEIETYRQIILEKLDQLKRLNYSLTAQYISSFFLVLAYDYTVKGNTVAIVSDGTAVLGLGNIGPKAAIPVMEGKAMLFKQFGGVDAFPICLDTQDPAEIIETVKGLLQFLEV